MGGVHEQRVVEVVVEGHLHGHPDPAGEVVVALEAILLGLDEGGVEDQLFCFFDGLSKWSREVPVFSHARESLPCAGEAGWDAGAQGTLA